METSEAKDVVQRLVNVMDGQLAAMKAEFGSRIDAVEKPTMVIMHTPEIEALRHCLTMLTRYDLHQVSGGWAVIDKLGDFAKRHEHSEGSANALLRFFVGKCDHAFMDDEGHCELCSQRTDDSSD